MPNWYHDSNSGHLVKANPDTLYIDLFESQSHTFNTMAENESSLTQIQVDIDMG